MNHEGTKGTKNGENNIYENPDSASFAFLSALRAFVVQNFPGLWELPKNVKSIPSEKTNTETREKTKLGNPWLTILFNDEVHSFDEVILQIQKATGYSLERATQLTLQVHHNGKAMVFAGARPKCEKVAGILGQIRLMTRVEES